MDFSIPVFQRRRGPYLAWTTVGLGPFSTSHSALSAAKVEELVTRDLKKAIRESPAQRLGYLAPKRGLELVRVRVDCAIRGAGGRVRFTGELPLVLETRRFNAKTRVRIAYHPLAQDTWFPVYDTEPLSALASAFFARSLVDRAEDALEDLRATPKDLLRLFSLSARVESPLDALHRDDRGIWDDLSIDPARTKRGPKKSKAQVLASLGTDLTQALVAAPKNLGLPRSPHREQLQAVARSRMSAGGRAFAPVYVVGPAGVGKTTLLRRFVVELAESEGYGSHKNLDRITHVWELSGKRLIAGMSHLGEWEERVVDLLAEIRSKPVILLIRDLHRFGLLGRSRDSDRALANLFRGALARREIAVIGEGTSSDLARLESDAPSLADLFVRVPIQEPSPGEAFRMLLHEAREAEAQHKLRISPLALRALVELSGAFGAAASLPGRATRMLDHVVAHVLAEAGGPASRDVDVAEVVAALSSKLGVPRALLSRDAAIERDEVERRLAEQVLGQPEATRAAADLIVRIKAGLVDARRPYGVYLFTGPTGTGKTELAKCIAEYLFGSAGRLVRFDMSEFSGLDAAARLVGDRLEPEGLLTRAVRDKPLSVLLLDEIDKAHPSVHGLLLQLFEDARLTDAAGNTARFENTVIVMTSNIGARSRAPVGVVVSDTDDSVRRAAEHDVTRDVRQFFSPELYNRIDRVVPFRPLTAEVAVDVAEKELSKLETRRGLEARDVFVAASRSLVERVAREALAGRGGARSLKRFLEDRIVAKVAEIVASAPSASLRRLHLFDEPSTGELVVEDERLTEAPSLAWRSLVEDRLAHATPAEILADVAAERPRLVRLLKDARANLEVAALATGARFHAEALVDELVRVDEALADLSGRAHARPRDDDEDDDAAGDDADDEDFDARKREVVFMGRGHTYQRVTLRTRAPAAPLRTLGREDLLRLRGRIEHLARAVESATDATAHNVVLEIVRVAAPRTARFTDALESPTGTRRAALDDWLARSYLAIADELAGRAGAFDGATVARGGRAIALSSAEDLSRELTTMRADCIVLSLSAIGVRDALAHEEGCHVWQPLAESPEIVRVRVLPAGTAPLAAAKDYLARAAAFRRAMQLSSGLDAAARPSNPASLTPMVRRFRFEPPARPGALAPLEVEDYVLGLVREPPVREPVEALRALIWARLSREDEAAS
ncbi:MAG: AAA family ATPase [Polyangiaceae bacterium]